MRSGCSGPADRDLTGSPGQARDTLVLQYRLATITTVTINTIITTVTIIIITVITVITIITITTIIIMTLGLLMYCIDITRKIISFIEITGTCDYTILVVWAFSVNLYWLRDFVLTKIKIISIIWTMKINCHSGPVAVHCYVLSLLMWRSIFVLSVCIVYSCKQDLADIPSWSMTKM